MLAGLARQELAADEAVERSLPIGSPRLVDERGAVGVAVEGDAEVGAGLAHLGAEVAQVLELQRIGLVVGEGAVELEVERHELDVQRRRNGS